MKIELVNRQNLLKIDRRRVETLALGFATRPGPAKVVCSRLTIVLVRDREMRALKRDLFGEDVVTDVISLGYSPLPGETGEGGAADVFVNVEQACRVAATGLGFGEAGPTPIAQRTAEAPIDTVGRPSPRASPRAATGLGFGEAGPTLPVARELALYLAHGIDHLRGGDDATPAGRASMRRRDLRWVKWAEQQGLLGGVIL